MVCERMGSPTSSSSSSSTTTTKCRKFEGSKRMKVGFSFLYKKLQHA
jgi:hypothetical protein